MHDRADVTTVGGDDRDRHALAAPRQPWFLRSAWRLYGTLLVTLAVPTIALLALGGARLRADLRAQAARENAAVARLVARALDRELYGLVRYVSSYAGRRLLRRAIADGNADAVRATLSDLVAQNELISRVLVADRAGVLRFDYPEDPSVAGVDFSARDWYRGAAARGGPYVSEFYRRAASGQPYVVAVAVPLTDDAGETSGYLVAQTTLSALTSWLETVTPASSSTIVLIDQHGHVALKRDADGDLVPLEADSPLRRLPETPAGSREAPDPLSGQPALLNHVRVPLSDWTVVARQPVADVDQPVAALLRTLFIYFLACLAGMAAIGASWFATLRRYDTARTRAQEALREAHDGLERRVAERTAELASAVRDLERSNRELEQFAYVASHDLQEPLRMISSYTQLLARRYRGRLDPDADEFIAYAVDGATRMKQLINDLLAFSRVGTRAREPGPVDCEEALDQALDALRQALAEAQAQIVRQPLPTVRGDATQIAQLFQNLVGNALKYRGESPARVRIAAQRHGRYWTFQVQDDGIGFDPKFADRIFVIFRRLHGSEAYPGTGIGLAICKRIVERHGGRIWAESRSGAGSTFYFTLPALEPNANDDRQSLCHADRDSAR